MGGEERKPSRAANKRLGREIYVPDSTPTAALSLFTFENRTTVKLCDKPTGLIRSMLEVMSLFAVTRDRKEIYDSVIYCSIDRCAFLKKKKTDQLVKKNFLLIWSLIE